MPRQDKNLKPETRNHTARFLRTCFTLSILIFALTFPALAQHPSYRQYTVHDGLVQQQVTCLFQGSRGYIWVGTKYGLSKFDGEQFENFTEKDGLPHQAVWDVLEDDQGFIWVYTMNGLARYDGANWKAFPFTLKTGGSFTFIPGNKILLWGDQYNLLLFQDGRYSEVLDSQGVAVPAHTICYNSIDRKALVHRKAHQVWEYDDGKTRALDIEPGAIQRVVPLGNHCGYTIWEEDGNTYHLVDFNTSDTLLSFQADRKSQLNFRPHVTQQGDIYFIFGQELYQKRKTDSIPRLLELTNYPNTVLEDTEGHIWIGTEFGLIQYFPDGFQYYSETETPNPWGVVEDDSGTYWSPQYRFGLYRFREGETPEKVPAIIDGQEILNYYFRPSKDRRGHLYFPHSSGVIKYDGRQFTPALSREEYAPTGQPTAILTSYYDPVDDVVLAGAAGKAIVIHPDGAKSFLENRQGRHQKSYVLCAVRDQHDNYWLGSFTGLSRYHIPSGTMHYYLPEEDKLPAKGVASLAVDSRGTLWIGGLAGLYRFDYEAEAVIPVDTNLFTSPINCLNTMDSSLLLVAEMSDIKAVDLSAYYQSGKLRAKNFNYRNGFLGIEPNQNSAYIDSRNRYWLPSSNGLYYIPVADIDMETFPSRVRVTRLNGRKVGFHRKADAIALPSGVDRVQLDFESIGFAHPVRTQYSYRLPRQSETWSPWQESRSAFFANLSSGNYTFELRSRHPAASQESHYQIDSLEFRIALPFYQEPDFYKWSAGISAALFTLALLFMFLVIRYFRRDRENQAAIREKENQIKYYQVQTLQAQLNPHFLTNALTTIQNYLREEDRDAAIEQLLRLAAMMRRFMESSIHSDIGNLLEDNSEISLDKEIELLRYYIELMQIQYPDVFDYEIKTGQELEPSLAYIPPLVLQPFVENAIEHGLRHRIRKGNLWLSFRLGNGHLLCTIEDNGIGRKAAAAMQRQSERMFQSRGTRLVQERVALLKNLGHRVEISISDRHGGGTRVAIIFEMK